MEKLLSEGLIQKEYEYLKDCVCLAKELLECDVLLMKLGKPDPENMPKPAYSMGVM